MSLINLDRKSHSRAFVDLVEVFDSWYHRWQPKANGIRIEDFFGEGKGVATAIKLLRNEGILKVQEDFRGIYVFIKSGKPFYVGISKHVIHRINQHVKGSNHFTSSLSYKLGADSYLEIHHRPHEGGREGLDFAKYAKPAKEELMKCDVSMMPVSDELELYLFEVYMAMRLKTLYYNEFKTH